MSINRRQALKGAITAGTVLAARSALAQAAAPEAAAPFDVLARAVEGRLMPVRSPLQVCAAAQGLGADALFESLKNPYLLGDEPGLTQTLGWVDAWTSQPSAYAVAAESAADVVAAVSFARDHGLKLVIKGGGHSYFGNSNATGSLLLWTRRMAAIEVHDAFNPTGAFGIEPVPAVSVGAGATWGKVYEAVAVKAGRYVQGGGCLTVGVAGFVGGGGFGSLSKAFGTGAANLLEAEVVTADGQIRTASPYQDPELFFALRGGGGGTFGVVTRLTLRTDPLPSTIGAVQFSVTAASDDAWRRLVAHLVAFYAEALFNTTWGEQLRFSPGRRLSVAMLFHSLSEADARATWQPFMAWLADRSGDYKLAGEPLVIALPARRFWDAAFLRTLPGIVLADDRPGAPASNVFWASNQGEAAQVIHAYQSAWMPAALLARDRQDALVDALVAAAAAWSVTLHTNKGLASGAPDALARTRETATNPAVLDAFALLICGAEGPPAWPGIPGHEPDVVAGRAAAARVNRAMQPIRQLVPDAGSYMSEADYFGSEWQRSYWGSNYERLLAAKRLYDPTNIFAGYHTVGSA